MPGTCEPQEFELFIADVEERASKAFGVGGGQLSMDVFPAIVFAAGVVEYCEETNHILDSPAACGQVQSIPFHASPVRRPMDRFGIALELANDVSPDFFPVNWHETVGEFEQSGEVEGALGRHSRLV